MKRYPALALILLLAALPALASNDTNNDAESRLTADTFSGLQLRGIGPALMSGRISDIAIHPEDRATWYVTVGSGGVWKTVNAGTTWEPLFDDQSVYSIGCVALDPSNPEVVWVGSGENVSGRHVGLGDGVYKSLDGGKTWTNMGLATSEHIGKILIDPRHANTIYVAAEGPLWSAGGERGVYKSIDGGVSWKQVLAVSENTGITDLAFDPANPDTLYAAAYQRRRKVWGFLAGGPESGLYKSTDAGTTWRALSNGLPGGDKGRIGLAISPLDPRIVYATIEAEPEEKGFYRSTDRGESWEKRSDYTSGGTGPHYYNEIYASPHKLDRVYQMDVWMRVSEDGGTSFHRVGEPDKHSDNHALAFDPRDPDYLLAGCDGGLYETWDHGASWRFVANLPVTQFYKMAVDNDTPFYNIVGGTQDNNTQLGPSRTANVHGIRNEDWIITVGGDGYACQIDPEDPNTVYSEWQYGGLTRFDKRSGEVLDIKPQPGADEPPERWNWDAPILISPHDSKRLYFASHRVWRSDDRGDSWTPISGDLSRRRNRYELPMMGRVWSVDALYDHRAMSWYGNLTSLAESPLAEGLLYAGSDDGLIHVSEDGGASWRRTGSLAGAPDTVFVNELKASHHDADTVFAAVDNHKEADYKPYLLKSTDRGRSWRSIAGDLPDRHFVWSMAEDHVDPDLLFCGTEGGLHFTLDGGAHWIALRGGVPTIAFRDIEIQRRENDLVAASFGRGFYIFDDYAVLRHVSEAQLAAEATLFPVKDTYLFEPSLPLGLPGKANLGSAHYAAPNPPFGAIFTYYLRDDLETAKERRRTDEKALREGAEDVPFPGWETLREENREAEPLIELTVRDGAGKVVRRLTAPATAGFHRLAWDLRAPASTPTDLEPPDFSDPWNRPPQGPLLPPGRYTVELAKRADGERTPLGAPQPFSTVPLPGSPGATADWSAIADFQAKTADLERRATGALAALEAAQKRLRFLDKALDDTPSAPAALRADIRALERGLADLEEQLIGDTTLGRYSEPYAHAIFNRVWGITGGHWSTTSGPTATHRQSYAIAAAQMEEVSADLAQLIDHDLVALEKAMEEAGAPWTPGRTVPGGSW